MELDPLMVRWLGAPVDRVVPVFLLVLARTAPLSWLSPWLGWTGIATFVRVTVALVLALALTPLALMSAPALPADWLALALLGTREALVGAAFAVAVSVPLYAMGWTGELVDALRGSRPDAGVTGPSGDSSPLGALHLVAAVVLFVTLGGHRLALAAFADGLLTLPPGEAVPAASLSVFALGVARLVTHALELAVAFAVPALATFLVLEVALGLFGRVAPTIRLWMEGMSLRAALGVGVTLLGLSALLPHLGAVFARSIDAAARLVQSLGA